MFTFDTTRDDTHQINHTYLSHLMMEKQQHIALSAAGSKINQRNCLCVCVCTIKITTLAGYSDVVFGGTERACIDDDDEITTDFGYDFAFHSLFHFV